MKILDQSKWPQNIADLYKAIKQSITDMDRDELDLDEMSQQICINICAEFGGRQFYLPKGTEALNAMRDARMWEEFDGNNHLELARKYKISGTRVYQILAKQRKLNEEKRIRLIH